MNNNLIKLSKLKEDKFAITLKKNKLEALKAIKQYLDEKYYNSGETCEFSDAQYDVLKDIIYSFDTDKPLKKSVGAQIREGENRVKIPYYLGSMDKIKPEDTSKLKNWLKKNACDEYVVSDKLDGASCLLTFNPKTDTINLYTRGDGIIGADITHLLKYIKNIPKLKGGVAGGFVPTIAVRGELIINQNVFKEKYVEQFANPRNMVSGLINSKTYREGLNDIDYIAYEIISDEDIQSKPSEQFQYLKKLGFETAQNQVINKKNADIKEIDMDTMSEILFKSLTDNCYEIDGIIVQSNVEYTRNVKDNPSYCFAFKINLNFVEAVVEGVEWNISKRGLLKPRIRIVPVQLDGVTITYSSAFNGKYVFDKCIGKGTIVKLIRSGQVIPFIVDVIKCSEEPDMPSVNYHWNETHVDIIAEEDDDNVAAIKLISSFFAHMKIKNVSEKTVEKIYNAGYTTLEDIFEASIEDFQKIEGFQKTLAEKVYNNIHNGLQSVTKDLVLGSSGIFGEGLGQRKIKALLDAFPDILETKLPDEKILERIVEIEGFSSITAEKVIEHLNGAREFLKSINKYVTYEALETKSLKLEGKSILFSGYRNNELEKEIVINGGKVVTSISKSLSILIVKDKNPLKKSSKIEKAENFGTEIMLEEEFVAKYL